MNLIFALLLLGQAGEPNIDKLLGDEPAKVAPAPSTTPAPMTPAVAPLDAAAAPAVKSAEGTKSEAPAGNAKPAEPASEDKAAAKTESNWLSDMLNSGALGYMIAGGIFMWPILILGILALGVIIERFR